MNINQKKNLIDEEIFLRSNASKEILDCILDETSTEDTDIEVIRSTILILKNENNQSAEYKEAIRYLQLFKPRQNKSLKELRDKIINYI